MNPHIKRAFRQAVRAAGLHPERVLEVGGWTGGRSLVRCPELAGAELICLNINDQSSKCPVAFVQGSGNDMHMFESDSFDIVASNAMLEHDRRFWLSVSEMRRVLRPGGLLFIGVPGYVPVTFDDGTATRTYRFHGREDYWRFSDLAVRQEFFDGFVDVTVKAILDPPRIVGHGRKAGHRARLTSGRSARGFSWPARGRARSTRRSPGQGPEVDRGRGRSGS
jgi:SAM-dependent methyltransferase